MEQQWKEQERHTVRKGQHKLDITFSCLDFESYIQQIDEEEKQNIGPWETSKQFTTDLMKVIGPHLSIVDLRHMMEALAQQYEEHWTWRNEWEKKQGEAHKNIELTDTKHTSKVENE